MNHTSIKTYEDACVALGIDPNTVTVPSDTKDEAAYKKLKVVARALNGDWTPNWGNHSERKYMPWFTMGDSSGAGFSCDGCDGWYSGSAVGSRLCFKSRELAEYAGEQFTELYKDFMLV